MAVDIRIARGKKQIKQTHAEEIENLVTPGDIITSDQGFMRLNVFIYLNGTVKRNKIMMSYVFANHVRHRKF